MGLRLDINTSLHVKCTLYLNIVNKTVRISMFLVEFSDLKFHKDQRFSGCDVQNGGGWA